MKLKAILPIFSFLILNCYWSYGQTNNDNFEPIKLENWKSVPAISRRVATEEDMKNGSAIYYLKNAGENHKFCDIELPKLAYLNNSENNTQELIVIIQVETTDKGTIAGYRKINGGSGACFLNEITFLSESDIKKVVTGKS